VRGGVPNRAGATQQERPRHEKKSTGDALYDGLVSTTWPERAVSVSQKALRPLADPRAAPAMEAYMKGVAPFLGVRAEPRRRALRAAWRELPTPRSDELGQAFVLLMELPEREYHHGASDLIATYLSVTDEYFLVEYVADLVTTKSWWDTVDAFGSAAVSPLCWRYDATELIDSWSRSQNLWLNRAAIQHQRGWGRDTDVGRVLYLCDLHSQRREFFIAKAIGWALRDLARLDPSAVRHFLRAHPTLSGVAVREARRGLGELAPRTSRSSD